MKHRIYFSIFIGILPSYIFTSYNLQQLGQLTGLSEQEVISWANILQERGDSHENFASYYGVFSNIINTYNLKRGCEVGVAYGGHSYDILKKTAVETLYCIDPFAVELHPELGQRNIVDLHFLRVKSRLSNFGNRVQMIRDYSLKAAELFEDNELDFVFVDADHSYESVKADLAAWYKKVRPGGILGGDDYATQWPGVPQAINEFVRDYDLTLHIDKQEPRIWWVQKPLNSVTHYARTKLR